MLFKTTDIAVQHASLHPALRRALTETDAVISGWGFPEMTLTEAARTKAANIAIYTAVYMNEGDSEAEATKMAEAQFSWHLCLCAADFRSSSTPYTSQEIAKILTYLRGRYTKPMWEVLSHDVGLGLHFHLAYRDFNWRRKWEQQEARAKRFGGEA